MKTIVALVSYIKLTPGLCKMYIAIKPCYLKTVTHVVNVKTF